MVGGAPSGRYRRNPDSPAHLDQPPGGAASGRSRLKGSNPDREGKQPGPAPPLVIIF